MKVSLKQTLSLMLALTLILPGAMILSPSLEAGAAETSKYADKLKVEPVKLPEGKTAAEYLKNPAQPDIYTLRSDFKVERNGDYDINYQPYVATVGAAATKDEKDQVNKKIKFPDFPGYGKPKDNGTPLEKFLINYDKVVNEAKTDSQPSGNDEYGKIYQKTQDFKYDAEKKIINVRHVFQDISDFEKYGNKPGETGETTTTAEGSVGSNLKIPPLPEDEIKGFVPETEFIEVQVPLNTAKFTVEYRYNRNHYDVTFDTAGGTEVPSRTLYYQQVIPPVENDVPTKVGATFQGWKPSMKLKDKAGNIFKADEVIKDSRGKAIKDLNANLIMPSKDIKFTAVWKDNDTADYAIQFWTEKADYPEGASLLEKYDFVGTHVYRNEPTGKRHDLDNEPIKGLEFPDLDQDRLNKIWNGARFDRDQYLFLNKFYKYNKDLTHKENADPNDSTEIKAVSSNGKTVYNIYYDRQVYELYFTKSNAPDRQKTSFYPEIWRYNKQLKQSEQLGGPGNPYHFTARFNQLMTEWPDDAQETKGFSEGKQSYGWGPNFDVPFWMFRDTPPYRLSADDFLDMPEYESKGGYTRTIDLGEGKTLQADSFTTLSFGITEGKNAIPHHMDFWMDGFEPGETIIDYNLYRTKADTDETGYGHKYPVVQGFTKKYGTEKSVQLTEDEIDDKNDERAEKTPFPDKKVTDAYGFTKSLGQMSFLQTFYDRADNYGDPKDGGEPFKINGYIKFKYSRNKYKLRLNYDPTKLKADNEYAEKEQKDIFYQKPLKDLDLDNPQTLRKLGLTALLEQDAEGNDRIKRPDGLGDQMVFKGWALDPAGQKLVWENEKETMPAHNLVLYAKWGEPDHKWKVTFDPNGGKLESIAEENVTTARKIIKEGDAGKETKETYAKKGADDGDKQVFTLVHRQKLVEPKKPTRKGYSFMGWEALHFKKDANTGEYTDKVDNSYRKTYGVPELYSYGNDVVSPIYLKAIWVKNDMQDVKVLHHFLDNNLAIDKTIEDNPAKETIGNQRAGKLVAATGAKQDANWILASDEELRNTTDEETKKLYDDYQKLADELGNRATKSNPYFQTLLVEAKKKSDDGTLVDNPNNEFHFFYRPFRSRHYKVNYVDERAKTELAKATTDAKKKEIIEKYRILDQEPVTSGARHYDARNYKPIIGWKLVSDPQQQLFYDVDEKTNKLKGTNARGTEGVDFFYKDNEINFFYKDVRVIEVPKDDPTPQGYVRVIFKASDGGSFGEDKEGNPIKEIHYDVLEGTKFESIPVPKELKKDEDPEKDKYYLTPEDGKTFEKWDQNPLLPDNTPIKKADEKSYVFTAMFDWFTLTTEGMATTESFADPANTWTNDFAPKLDDLKQLIKAKGKDNQIKPLPEYESIDFYDADGKEVKTPADIYELVNEKGKTDEEEVVRTITLNAKVKIKGEKNTREIDVPIKVYKNRYDALPSGEMPDFLKKATTGNGDLVKLLDGRTYVKVTVKPSSRLGNLTPKSYWVNPKAWVEIPEIAVSDGEKTATGFKHWSANKAVQNEGLAKLGVYDFNKRHKFSEDTVITPVFVDKVVTPAPEKKENKPVVSPGPVTGANALLYLYTAALFTAAGTALVISRTRRKAQRA